MKWLVAWIAISMVTGPCPDDETPSELFGLKSQIVAVHPIACLKEERSNEFRVFDDSITAVEFIYRMPKFASSYASRCEDVKFYEMRIFPLPEPVHSIKAGSFGYGGDAGLTGIVGADIIQSTGSTKVVPHK